MSPSETALSRSVFRRARRVGPQFEVVETTGIHSGDGSVKRLPFGALKRTRLRDARQVKEVF